jgi:ABC-type transport system substrate-binding protein
MSRRLTLPTRGRGVAGLAACGALAVVAAGCGGGGAAGGSGADGGGTKASNGATLHSVAKTDMAATLRVAAPISTATWDPAASTNSDQFPLLSMVVESLTRYAADNKIVPGLATKWSTSADGKTWTFDLRPNVKFSDGEAFDGDAVKTSIERLVSPKTFNASPQLMSVIEKVDVISPLKVELKLSKPYAGLAAALSLPSAGIMAPKSITEGANSMKTVVKPVGTGPYTIVKAEVGGDATFKANPTYWGPKPYYGTQIYQYVPEDSSRIAEVRAGQADIAELPPMSNLKGIEADPTLQVIKANTSMMLQVLLNTADSDQPLMKKTAVRKALSLAIDRKTIVDKILFGAGTVPTSVMSKVVPGYCAAGDFSYDPAKAKQMLKAAGATGMTVRLMGPQGRYLQDSQVTQAVAGYFRDAGVKVDLANPLPFADYITKLYVPSKEATFDAGVIGLSTSYGEPSHDLRYLMTSSLPPDGFNSAYYSNAKVDADMDKANESSDQGERDQLYCQVQKQVMADQPTIPLYSQNTPIVTKAGIDGIYAINTWFVTTYATPKATR